MINYCIDEQKKKKRVANNHRLIDQADGSISEQEQATRMSIDHALEVLEPHIRHVINLKYRQDLTLTEIASILDCPVGTVKTWLHKGLEILRKKMKKEGGYIE